MEGILFSVRCNILAKFFAAQYFTSEISAKLFLSKYHWSGDGYRGCVQRRVDELTPPLGLT